MRFAVHLWTKPSKLKSLKVEEELLLSSEAFLLKVKPINKTINCYHWRGEGPKILLVHGWI